MFHRSSKPKKRDPIRHAPLPQAGDSAYQHMIALLLDKALLWVLLAILASILAGLQWIAWLYPRPVHPILPTLVALIFVVLAVVKVRPALRQMENLKLGLRGERVVGQRLEPLRTKGYRVFHDIPGDGFNIDHVLIGPGGVFVVETKTASKPAEGDARVTYDGQRVLVNGYAPDRDPVAQARACAARVREMLEQATEIRPKVRPVVLYPGWWVDKQPRGVDVWVLNPDGFLAFVEKEPVVLRAEQIGLLASALECYLRARP